MNQICGKTADEFIRELQGKYPAPVSHTQDQPIDRDCICTGGMPCAYAHLELKMPIPSHCERPASDVHYWSYYNYAALRFPSARTLAAFLTALNPAIKNAYWYANLIISRNDDGYFSYSRRWLHLALTHHQEGEQWVGQLISKFQRGRGILRAKTHEITTEERDNIAIPGREGVLQIAGQAC